MLSASDRYIEEHSSDLDDALDWVVRQTHLRTNWPQMLCGPQKGRLLKLLVEISGASNILEVGTFTGYSSICLALALGEGGHIDTLEKNDELEDIIRGGWERAGVSDKLTLHICDALEWLEGNRKEYDLIYIDANKREYALYYKAASRALRPGGLLLADDVLMGGKVLDTDANRDAQTLGIAAFNELLASDSSMETVMLPLHDGLTVSRKIL